MAGMPSTSGVSPGALSFGGDAGELAQERSTFGGPFVGVGRAGRAVVCDCSPAVADEGGLLVRFLSAPANSRLHRKDRMCPS